MRYGLARAVRGAGVRASHGLPRRHCLLLGFGCAADPWQRALGLAACAFLEDETRDFDRARELISEADSISREVTPRARQRELRRELKALRESLSASLG